MTLEQQALLDQAEEREEVGKEYWRNNDCHRAEMPLLRAIELKEQVLGAEHEALIEPLRILGYVYLHSPEGTAVQAEKLFRRVLNIRQRRYGVWHPSLSETLYDLAQCCSGQGRPEEAEALYQRALQIPTDPNGREGMHRFYILEGYAGFLHERKRYEESKALEVQASRLRDKDSQGLQQRSTTAHKRTSDT